MSLFGIGLLLGTFNMIWRKDFDRGLMPCLLSVIFFSNSIIFTDAQGLDRLARMPQTTYYEGESANMSHLIDSLIYGYDKRLRPNYKGPPVEVGITMFVSSVSSVSEVDMDYTIDFYFRQNWHDPRLTFADADNDELCISNEMLEKIWWPDTFFANAKDAKFHHATTKNAFLRIKPSGHVLQSLRLTVTADCKMDLTYFPFDSQICSLEIESYGYSTNDIKYYWYDGRNKSVGIHEDVQLPQFNVKGHRATEKLEKLTTGNYSRLSCSFFLTRNLGYYIIQIYVPGTLIGVLSWVSFWLPWEAVPARVALGIMTVLTMTTLISSTNASLPKISYLKSIDVYLVTCFVMVFGSIIEYAAVCYLGNHWKKKNTSDQGKLITQNGDVAKDLSEIEESRRRFSLDLPDSPLTEVRLIARRSHSHGAKTSLKRHCGRRSRLMRLAHPSNLDRFSRIVFPLFFCIFNVVYWSTYHRIANNQDVLHFISRS